MAGYDNKLYIAMKVIIPCIEPDYENFTEARPNYLLADYSSKRLIELCVDTYIETNEQVVVIIAKKDAYKFEAELILKQIFGNILQILVTTAKCNTQAVYEYLTNNTLDYCHIRTCNGIIRNLPITNSYQIFYARQPLAYTVCAADFVNAYVTIANNEFQPTMYQVIQHLQKSGTTFSQVSVDNFLSLVSKQDWEDWCNKPTIFCDIDGTVVVSQAPYGKNSYATPYVPIYKNVYALRQQLQKGAQIIFTTSRKTEWFKQTRAMLDELGFENCQLLMDMHHARRILINDYAPTNKYPSAVAINLKRNEDSLENHLWNAINTTNFK